MLDRIQNDLFDLGADLATPESDDSDMPRLTVTATQVERLETEINLLNDKLAPLNSFVLPGGSAAAASLHLARTVARRAERRAVTLAEAAAVNPEAIRYLNRLSDLLFVMARHANNDGADDVLWKPGDNR